MYMGAIKGQTLYGQITFKHHNFQKFQKFVECINGQLKLNFKFKWEIKQLKCCHRQRDVM